MEANEMGATKAQRRALLEYVLQSDYELVRELVSDPGRVLAELGLDEAALRCPESAHEALERGDAAAEAMAKLDDADLQTLLPKTAHVAANHFGADFRVEKVPFGVQFAERVILTTTDSTATASVICTFGIKCKGDTDG